MSSKQVSYRRTFETEPLLRCYLEFSVVGEAALETTVRVIMD